MSAPGARSREAHPNYSLPLSLALHALLLVAVVLLAPPPLRPIALSERVVDIRIVAPPVTPAPEGDDD